MGYTHIAVSLLAHTGNGSPVCVAASTSNVITSTASNCDTYVLDFTDSVSNGCPLYLKCQGYMGR